MTGMSVPFFVCSFSVEPAPPFHEKSFDQHLATMLAREVCVESAKAHSHRPRIGIHPELSKRISIEMHSNLSTQLFWDKFQFVSGVNRLQEIRDVLQFSGLHRGWQCDSGGLAGPVTTQ